MQDVLPAPLPAAPTPRRAIDPNPLLRSHLWTPLAIFALVISIIAALKLDWLLAHRIYAWEGYRWILRDAFLTDHLLHRFGRNLSIAAWLGVLVCWLLALRRGELTGLRRPLAYLMASVLTSTVLIALIKAVSNIDCPWDIEGLGGARPYLGLFDLRPALLPDASCFPAGHASSGYAWAALYFFFLMVHPALRWRGLMLGLGAGALFGAAQQVRGAHFLSHDLWTAAICWVTALALYLRMRPKLVARPD